MPSPPAAYQPVGQHPSPSPLERTAAVLRSRRVHALLAACFVLALVSLTPAAAYDVVAAHAVKLHSDAAALAPWLHVDALAGPGGTASASSDDTATRWPECKPAQVGRDDDVDEHEHRVAYLFMVHTKETLEGARQLVEHVWNPNDLFVVHVDAKMNDSLVARYRDSMGACGNVQFVDEERVDVEWGKWSEVFAEVTLVRHALRSDVPWTKTILIDGTSWPRLDARARQAWLSRWQAVLEAGGAGPAPEPVCKAECSSVLGRRAWDVTCIDCGRGPARCVDAECKSLDLTPHGAHVRKDHQWFLLTREMAEYAVAGPDYDAWAAYFEGVHAPSEHFFVTMLYTQYPTLGRLPPAVYVDWIRPCKSHKSTDGSHPCELGIKDLERIRHGDGLFARKIRVDETALRTALLDGQEAVVSLPLSSLAASS
ncbi:hypothetical protein JCM8208_002666 [Rhodotorula glutinis]